MADSKDPTKDPAKGGGEGFFRKVARFVVNPTTDWTDLNNPPSQLPDNDPARSELKAMIERKRRNDFVRKREFDMLRKIRREGITGEGLAGLEGLSRIDDSDLRSSQDSKVRPDAGVKAKIDAIEQQMVGDDKGNTRNTGSAPLDSRSPSVSQRPQNPGEQSVSVRTSVPAMSESFFDSVSEPAYPSASAGSDAFKPTAPMTMDDLKKGSSSSSGRKKASAPHDPMAGFQPIHLGHLGLGDLNAPIGVEVTELAHDPELDEVVIAFANADFELCERILHQLISPGGARTHNGETWDVLFDLYRATGQQQKFENFAMEYVQRFGFSAPQWYSLPKLAAEVGVGQYKNQQGAIPRSATAGWAAPATMDLAAVTQLRTQMLQMPLPWVLDWRAIRRIDAEGCAHLTHLLHDWADEPIEMRWIGGDHLFDLLAELAPAGVKDADPAYWLLRMETLRMANRTVEFDQTAMDYCMTYEVSPPSWAPAKCSIRLSGDNGATISPALHTMPDMNTSFLDSDLTEETREETATVEISGHLVGDLGTVLKDLDAEIGGARFVTVSCQRLIRIDFIAAGDLLNWVVVRNNEGRTVTFENAHRLVALFCDTMGFKEHARIKIRTV